MTEPRSDALPWLPVSVVDVGLASQSVFRGALWWLHSTTCADMATVRKHSEEVVSPGNVVRHVTRWSLEAPAKAGALTILPFTTTFAPWHAGDAAGEGVLVIAKLSAAVRAGEPAVGYLRLKPGDALFWDLLAARSGWPLPRDVPRFSPWHNLVFKTVKFSVPLKVVPEGECAPMFKKRAAGEVKNPSLKFEIPFMTNAVDLPLGTVLEAPPSAPGAPASATPTPPVQAAAVAQ